MISIDRMKKFLKSIWRKSKNEIEIARKSYIPQCIKTVINKDVFPFIDKLNIRISREYRYRDRWYHYKFSVEESTENFGILKIDNIFTTSRIDDLVENRFMGFINGLVYNGYIKSFILLLDNKMVPWDRIEMVYDNNDVWLILHGEEYNIYELDKIKNIDIILFPYRLEYVGTNSLFSLYYNALVEYFNKNIKYRDNKYFIPSIDLNSTYVYNNMTINVGGWAYEQMRLYNLGYLSDEQISKLRNINISYNEYNSSGDIIYSSTFKFNLLDMDVPMDGESYAYSYGRNLEDYNSHFSINFSEDYYYKIDGINRYYIMDDYVSGKKIDIDTNYIWDVSDIKGLLLRDNFLVFINNELDNDFKIMTSVNNIFLLPNPSKLHVSIVLIYNKNVESIYSTTSKFKREYINSKAREYFECIIHSAEYSDNINLPNRILKNRRIDAISEDNVYEDISYETNEELDESRKGYKSGMSVPMESDNEDDSLLTAQIDYTNKIIRDVSDYENIEDEDNNIKKKDTTVLINTDGTSKTDLLLYSSLSAHIEDSNELIRNITAYSLGQDFVEIPDNDNLMVFLLDSMTNEEAIEIISSLNKPLNFDFMDNLNDDENVYKALQSIVDYDVSILNKLYHTSIDSFSLSGKEANDALLYKFLHEDRCGIKIPRKMYRHHETYFMLFVNGELFSEYHRTIAYANFFFIPVENDFKFNDDDIIEIVYFKNVNNNEIRFYLSDYLIDQFTNNRYDARFYDIDIFSPYMRQSDMKIFSHYPREIIRYKTLITEESEDIAFNISYRDESNNLCIKKDALTHIVDEDIDNLIRKQTGEEVPDNIREAIDNMTIDVYKDTLKDNIYITSKGVDLFTNDRKTLRNSLVAVSSRKFIYQRLYIKERAYRIKLDSRFRYCDNPKQYLLFINGRRQRQDSFLITIPKHTRPFNGLYLYTSVFVGKTDRIELFYLPYDMTDINFDQDKRYKLQSNGYLEVPKEMLEVPLSKTLYMFFVNGKKIPMDRIIDVDSHTIRLDIDPQSMHYMMITKVNLDTLDTVSNYMKDDKDDEYDALIKYIKRRTNGYNILDNMFDSFIQMTDYEQDKLHMNVAKIAILNEIVRDWLVASGYDYQNQDIIYDYEQDEYFERLEDGTLILPALDANKDINIVHNDISLLYLYTDPIELLYEIGNFMGVIKFYWEYSQRLNKEWNIRSQRVNDVNIPTKDRYYETLVGNDRHFRWQSNTGQQIITRDFDIDFVNGTYWGVVDKDSFKYYEQVAKYLVMDDIVAVVPKDGVVPPKKQQEIESGNIRYKEYIEYHNHIIYGLSYGEMPELVIDEWEDPSLVNIYDGEFIAVCPDEKIIRNMREKMWYDDLMLYDDLLISGIDPSLIDANSIDILPPEPDIIYQDINILSDTFFAMSDDITYTSEFVLVEDIDMNIENPYDVEKSSELIAITDDHRVYRYLNYNNLHDMAEPEPIDYNGDVFRIDNDTFIARIFEDETDINDVLSSISYDGDQLIDYQVTDLETNEVYDVDSEVTIKSLTSNNIPVGDYYRLDADFNFYTYPDDNEDLIYSIDRLKTDINGVLSNQLKYEPLSKSTKINNVFDVDIFDDGFMAIENDVIIDNISVDYKFYKYKDSETIFNLEYIDNEMKEIRDVTYGDLDGNDHDYLYDVDDFLIITRVKVPESISSVTTEDSTLDNASVVDLDSDEEIALSDIIISILGENEYNNEYLYKYKDGVILSGGLSAIQRQIDIKDNSDLLATSSIDYGLQDTGRLILKNSTYNLESHLAYLNNQSDIVDNNFLAIYKDDSNSTNSITLPNNNDIIDNITYQYLEENNFSIYRDISIDYKFKQEFYRDPLSDYRKDICLFQPEYDYIIEDKISRIDAEINQNIINSDNLDLLLDPLLGVNDELLFHYSLGSTAIVDYETGEIIDSASSIETNDGISFNSDIYYRYLNESRYNTIEPGALMFADPSDYFSNITYDTKIYREYEDKVDISLLDNDISYELIEDIKDNEAYNIDDIDIYRNSSIGYPLSNVSIDHIPIGFNNILVDGEYGDVFYRYIDNTNEIDDDYILINDKVIHGASYDTRIYREYDDKVDISILDSDISYEFVKEDKGDNEAYILDDIYGYENSSLSNILLENERIDDIIYDTKIYREYEDDVDISLLDNDISYELVKENHDNEAYLLDDIDIYRTSSGYISDMDIDIIHDITYDTRIYREYDDKVDISILDSDISYELVKEDKGDNEAYILDSIYGYENNSISDLLIDDKRIDDITYDTKIYKEYDDKVDISLLDTDISYELIEEDKGDNEAYIVDDIYGYENSSLSNLLTDNERIDDITYETRIYREYEDKVDISLLDTDISYELIEEDKGDNEAYILDSIYGYDNSSLLYSFNDIMYNGGYLTDVLVDGEDGNIYYRYLDKTVEPGALMFADPSDYFSNITYDTKIYKDYNDNIDVSLLDNDISYELIEEDTKDNEAYNIDDIDIYRNSSGYISDNMIDVNVIHGTSYETRIYRDYEDDVDISLLDTDISYEFIKENHDNEAYLLDEIDIYRNSSIGYSLNNVFGNGEYLTNILVDGEYGDVFYRYLDNTNEIDDDYVLINDKVIHGTSYETRIYREYNDKIDISLLDTDISYELIEEDKGDNEAYILDSIYGYGSSSLLYLFDDIMYNGEYLTDVLVDGESSNIYYRYLDNTMEPNRVSTTIEDQRIDDITYDTKIYREYDDNIDISILDSDISYELAKEDIKGDNEAYNIDNIYGYENSSLLYSFNDIMYNREYLTNVLIDGTHSDIYYRYLDDFVEPGALMFADPSDYFSNITYDNKLISHSSYRRYKNLLDNDYEEQDISSLIWTSLDVISYDSIITNFDNDISVVQNFNGIYTYDESTQEYYNLPIILYDIEEDRIINESELSSIDFSSNLDTEIEYKEINIDIDNRAIILDNYLEYSNIEEERYITIDSIDGDISIEKEYYETNINKNNISIVLDNYLEFSTINEERYIMIDSIDKDINIEKEYYEDKIIDIDNRAVILNDYLYLSLNNDEERYIMINSIDSDIDIEKEYYEDKIIDIDNRAIILDDYLYLSLNNDEERYIMIDSIDENIDIKKEYYETIIDENYYTIILDNYLEYNNNIDEEKYIIIDSIDSDINIEKEYYEINVDIDNRAIILDDYLEYNNNIEEERYITVDSIDENINIEKEYYETNIEMDNKTIVLDDYLEYNNDIEEEKYIIIDSIDENIDIEKEYYEINVDTDNRAIILDDYLYLSLNNDEERYIMIDSIDKDINIEKEYYEDKIIDIDNRAIILDDYLEYNSIDEEFIIILDSIDENISVEKEYYEDKTIDIDNRAIILDDYLYLSLNNDEEKYIMIDSIDENINIEKEYYEITVGNEYIYDFRYLSTLDDMNNKLTDYYIRINEINDEEQIFLDFYAYIDNEEYHDISIEYEYKTYDIDVDSHDININSTIYSYIDDELVYTSIDPQPYDMYNNDKNLLIDPSIDIRLIDIYQSIDDTLNPHHSVYGDIEIINEPVYEEEITIYSPIGIDVLENDIKAIVDNNIEYSIDEFSIWDEPYIINGVYDIDNENLMAIENGNVYYGSYDYIKEYYTIEIESVSGQEIDNIISIGDNVYNNIDYWIEDYISYGDIFDPTYNDFMAIINDEEIYNELIYYVDDRTIVEQYTFHSLDIWDIFAEGFKVIDGDKEYTDLTLYPSDRRNYFMEHETDVDIEYGEAIMLSDGTNVDNIIYIMDEVEEEKVSINFYNEVKYGIVDAIGDDGNVISNGFWLNIDKPEDNKLTNIVIDVDEYDALRAIYPLENDRITKESLLAIDNNKNKFIDIHSYDINTNGFGYVMDNNDNLEFIRTDVMGVSANDKSEIQDIGFYDIERESMGLIDAIVDGSAMIIKNAKYIIDGEGINKDIVIYEFNDKIEAITLDGTKLDSFTLEDYNYSWTNINLSNISTNEFKAIDVNGGTILENLTIVYNESKPEIHHYYNMESLPLLIRDLDKYLVKEPANIELIDYDIGNYNYFVFACPKRLVYDTYHMISNFIFPDPYSDEINEHCYIDINTPIYTNGLRADATEEQIAAIGNNKMALYTIIKTMKMEYLGECLFTNEYGYTERYVVWKTNGYFTRLMDHYGIDIKIIINTLNSIVTKFHNRTRDNGNLNLLNNIQITNYYKESDFDMAITSKTNVNPKMAPKNSNIRSKPSSIKTVTFGLPKATPREAELLREKGIFLI